MLLALTTSQRVQTLKALNINSMTVSDNQCVFIIDSVLKTTRPGKHLTNISLEAYVENKNLCPLEHLKLYLARTSVVRGVHTQLLLSFQKPNRPVSTDTIARWIRIVMSKAGIDTKVFGAHSTRAATTSAAHKKGITIDKILSAAGWSNETTFRRFYNKPITNSAGYSSELVCAAVAE